MRLIDADALMQSLGITNMDCGKCAWYDAEWSHCKRGGDFEDACCAIENAPTIEDLSDFCDRLWRGAYERGKEDGKAEIVWCKDCKKREHCRTTNTWAIAPGDDWYCADGERMEQDELDR